MGPGEPLVTALPPAPVCKVEVMLDRSLRHRRISLRGRQLRRSTAWTTGSRSGAWLAIGGCEGAPSGDGSPWAVPLTGEEELPPRPRRRRHLRARAVPASAGCATRARGRGPFGATGEPLRDGPG